jgi:hypothetical protein
MCHIKTPSLSGLTVDKHIMRGEKLMRILIEEKNG